MSAISRYSATTTNSEQILVPSLEEGTAGGVAFAAVRSISSRAGKLVVDWVSADMTKAIAKNQVFLNFKKSVLM